MNNYIILQHPYSCFGGSFHKLYSGLLKKMNYFQHSKGIYCSSFTFIV